VDRGCDLGRQFPAAVDGLPVDLQFHVLLSVKGHAAAPLELRPR
jgi:hypothetical protein